MTVITITRSAKCKDCCFLAPFKKGKRKYHACSNIESPFYHTLITLKTMVCDFWKLIK